MFDQDGSGSIETSELQAVETHCFETCGEPSDALLM